MPLLGSSLKVA
jgi:hypothetical protein